MFSIPTDEKNITDEQVWNAFDLNYSGMEAVKEALLCQDHKKAKSELVAYFHKRKHVSFHFDYRGVPVIPIGEEEIPYIFQAAVGDGKDLKRFCLHAGQQMMHEIYTLPQNKGTSIFLGKHLETAPHFNCFTDSGKKSRTPSNMFTRGQWMEYLFFLYQETGDQAAADQFRRLLYQFWEQYPLVIEDTQKDAHHFQYTEDRTVMSVGFLALTYLELLYTEMTYAAGEDTVFDIIKHVWFLVIQFRRFDEDEYHPFNHHLWERGLVPFIFGVMFPEIPEFAVRKQAAASIICRHIKEDINLHGGYNEHSIGYWSGAVLGEMLFRGLDLAKRNQETLLDIDAEKRLERTFHALISIAPPNETYPSIGDSGGTNVETVLRLGNAMLQGKVYQELLNHRNGVPADLSDLSCYYSDDHVGFTCAKTDYSRNATYMLISTKVNCGFSGHNHMDMLSIVISIRGKEIITEPYAKDMYPRIRSGSAERGYHYNMTSHNTVLAYGSPMQPDMMYAQQYGNFRPDSPVTAFRIDPNGMYMEAKHNGYSFCTHCRSVLFSKHGAMLIHDKIWPGKRIEKDHIQRWHLARECDCRLIDPNMVLIVRENITLLLIWDHVKWIHIWKNDALLCQEMYSDEKELGYIIDAGFFEPDTDSFEKAGSHVQLMILDITDIKTNEIENILPVVQTLFQTKDEGKCLELLDSMTESKKTKQRKEESL